MKEKKIIGTLLPAAMMASGALFSAGARTLPPEADVKAAFDSVAKAYHFRQADDLLLMDRFLERFPASSYVPEVILMKGDSYFLQGLYPLAYSTYARITPEMFSGDIRKQYEYRYAFSMVKTGYHSKAKPLFRSLLSDKTYGNAAQFYIAYIDYVNGQYDKAYEGFSLVKPSAEGLEAEYYLNQIDFKRGDYRKVADRGSKLLSGDIDYQLRPETMRVTGLSWYKLGNIDKATPLLEDYVELKGDGAEVTAVYTLASILYDEGEYDRAETLFSTLTDDRGELAQSAWLYIGQINAARGDEQAAAIAFDRAAREGWNDDVAETAAYNLSVASASGNRLPFADSAKKMEDFIADYPNSKYSETLSRYLVSAYYKQHEYAKALRLLESMNNADPATSQLRQKTYYQYGQEQLRAGDTDGAIASLSKAASGSDREVAAQANIWLGDAYYLKKEYAKARTAYAAAAGSKEIGSNYSLANYDLGYSLMKLKKYGEAQTAFNNAINGKGLTPAQNADAKMRRADCLYYTGKYSEALKEFQSLAKAGNQDAVYAGIRQADIMGRNGNVKEKISLLQSLLDSGNTGVWTPTVLQRLGDAYSEGGDDAKAAAIYARILDSGNDKSENTQLFYSLATNAENLYTAGKTADALAVYERLQQSDIPEIYAQGVAGVMRTSDQPATIIKNADLTMRLPGVAADLTEEAAYRKACAQIALGGDNIAPGLEALSQLARNPESEWGANASLALGRYYLDTNQPAKAEEILLQFTDSGCEDSELLARGYIMLADAYIALDKSYLAKLYLSTLRENYPGGDKAVIEMIDSRLKKLNK